MKNADKESQKSSSIDINYKENDEREIQGEKASSMEDLLELAGTRGPWSWLLLALCSYIAFLFPFQSMSYQFFGVTPDHWCYIGPLIDANWTQEQIINLAIPLNIETGEHESCKMYNYNYTLAAQLGYNTSIRTPGLISAVNQPVISCSAREFNSTKNQATVVIQWDLVCERRAVYSTIQGITQVGYLLGSLIFGYLMDAFGRRPISLTCIVITVVLRFISPLSPNLTFYIIVRGIVSACILGIYTANFVIALESCSPSQRSTVGALFVMPYAFGYMILPGIAYWVQHWKWLQIVLTLPFCVLFISFWLLPESPRWLLLHGRYKEALKVLTMAARINRQTLPSQTTILSAMDRIAKKELASGENAVESNLQSRILNAVKSFFNLLIDGQYRMRILIFMYCWFSCSIVYYGISLNTTTLSANIYIYFFLAGLLEVPVYLLLWLWLSFRGRRNLLVTLLLVCSVCIASITPILILVPKVPVVATTFLSLCGKFCITAAFHLLWVYTAEMFPTKSRSHALGLVNVCARTGSVCSPYINDIMGEIAAWAPSAMFALASIVAAAVALCLPDSLGRNLSRTNSIQEDEAKQEN